MELDHLPWTSPDAFSAVCAPLVDNGDLRLLEFDRVFRAHTDAASAEIALSRNYVDH